MSDQINQVPSRPGQISSKRGNPYRGNPRILFLGRHSAEEEDWKRLAEEWDAAHPDGEDEGGGIVPA